MPDPTTAELLAAYAAIHRAEPATRPKRPGGYNLKLTSDESWAWYGSITRDIHIADEWDATNACRCTLEDWLMERGYWFTNIGGNGGGFMLNQFGPHGQIVGVGDYPTIHHALHAAFWSERS